MHIRILPFEKLVDELKPERDMSRSPLFQVMFMLQNAPMSEPALSGLKLETVDTSIVASKYDLTLDLVENEENISGAIRVQDRPVRRGRQSEWRNTSNGYANQ